MEQKGYSLHIGLNGVDPEHYQGWAGELNAAENDATVYQTIAEKSGFAEIKVLLTKEATSAAVFAFLDKAAKELAEGDLMMISYSGHGGSLPDLNGDEELDHMDETWCLYDREVIDDELYERYSKFKKGVRILIFSDSCHSGSVAKAVVTKSDVGPEDKVHYIKSRMAPLGVLLRTYNANKKKYDQISEQITATKKDIDAYVMLFGACQDSEEAMEVWDHGLFTAKVKEVLMGTVASYMEFYQNIKKGFNRKQHPNLDQFGNGNFKFINEKPFSLNGKAADVFFQEVRAKTVKGDSEGLILELNGPTDPEMKSKYYKRVWGNRAKPDIVVEGNEFVLAKVDADHTSAWDKAYDKVLTDSNVRFAEPDLRSPYLKADPLSKGPGQDDYMKNWPEPNPSADEFIWHLDDEHSQLKKARDFVLGNKDGKPGIRIGHIDTGYRPDHPSRPNNLLADLGVSFAKDEFDKNKGIDLLNTGFPAEQDGHGCATLAILAGNKISKEDSYAGFNGFFGAVPFAEVVPIRICDTVFNLFNANDVADGIDYAVDHGCEVITMSMAGYPTKRVAKAVDRAYMNGVVVVTAAGNNWNRGLRELAPKAVLYPARFQRVIAATGACYNHAPFDFSANDWQETDDSGGAMQGNWGPEKAMRKALAGYTPNLAWATEGESFKFSKSGNGTSSATPQVAAAAALWIAHNRAAIKKAGIEKSWKKVEAVRSALYQTASKRFPEYSLYFGNGIIRAFDALDAFDFSKVDSLTQSPESKVGLFGLGNFIGGWIRSKDKSGDAVIAENEDAIKEMVELELLQLIYRDPKLMGYANVADIDTEGDDNVFNGKEYRTAFINKVIDSPFASEFLKKVLQNN
ncbi:caspase family protein [Pedobacter sp. PLR]|uniref:S8 family serine peptidase n=1 Tax=Pedobacter sp. PLR TaxID=2994465 RepID=UPI002246F55E|nr:S8 family serine peptidase [Pedobacter sp. PLR]MCX2454331.1 caspase family protein [Pedobacter sp. PLR]